MLKTRNLPFKKYLSFLPLIESIMKPLISYKPKINKPDIFNFLFFILFSAPVIKKYLESSFV